LLDPGERELGDLRALSVDSFCFLGCHFLFEGGGRGGFFQARDGAPPIRPCLLLSALVAQRAVGAGLLRGAVNVGANSVVTIQARVVRERLSHRTGEAVVAHIRSLGM
jgi:hypothetical protein